jgi:hypothetical protein
MMIEPYIIHIEFIIAYYYLFVNTGMSYVYIYWKEVSNYEYSE